METQRLSVACHGHTAGKGQSRDLNPGGMAPESVLLAFVIS